jgi:hypothetical protein
MWALCLKLGLQLKLFESPMGYIKTNLNMDITFKFKYSYNFAIHAHVFIFTNYKFDLLKKKLNKICNKT